MKAKTQNFITYFTSETTPVKASYNHTTRIFRVVCQGELLYKNVMDETCTTKNLEVILKACETDYNEKQYDRN